MLTIHDRRKRREGLDFNDAICKALGWYFPLLAKLGVRSVEELVFRKFPGVCPYCRLAPHEEGRCKLVQGTERTVNHPEVVRIYNENWADRPKGLDDWQLMFQTIYPRSLEDRGRSTIGLLEELGELAEAVRVFDVHPQYFLGEAADTFSYIMGLANEHKLKLAESDIEFSFEAEFLRRYPGLCTQCGSKQCICPSVPQATIGRMAKELSIGVEEAPFLNNSAQFMAEGQVVAHNVLEDVGGYEALTASLPFDRGDTNRALVTLCHKLADSTAPGSSFSDVLRIGAYKLSTSVNKAGSPRQNMDLKDLLDAVRSAWDSVEQDVKEEIKSSEGMLGELGDILDTVRILFVFCSPEDEAQLLLSREYRAIKESLRLGRKGNKIVVEALFAATPTDLRRELMHKDYDIVHFSGHANNTHLVFETNDGISQDVPIAAMSEFVKRKPSIKCVILNACESVKSLKAPISPLTIGMDAEIDDIEAIEFSRGFYDGIAAGLSVHDAYREGITAVKFRDANADKILIVS